MQEIKVTEVRSKLPAYLRRVQEGEEMLLTPRGKAIARLAPVTDERVSAVDYQITNVGILTA